MVAPRLLSWIEQQYGFSTVRIDSRQPTGLVSITVETSQSQVFSIICTALTQWNDVIDREANILPLFRSVTVFAEMLRPSTHQALYVRCNLTAMKHECTC